MNKKDVDKLWNGVYRVYWKSGGSSLAAVGRTSSGSVWLAPTNWVSIDTKKSYWRLVERVVAIETT